MAKLISDIYDSVIPRSNIQERGSTTTVNTDFFGLYNEKHATPGDAEVIRHHKEVWVGLWNNDRLVIYDPKIQPFSNVYILLFFVDCGSICVRNREIDRAVVKIVNDIQVRGSAFKAFELWEADNPGVISRKRSQTVFQVEDPPVKQVELR